MDLKKLKKSLMDFRRGKIGFKEMTYIIKNLPYKDIGTTKIDFHRIIRRGFPEVIFGIGKSFNNLKNILEEYEKQKEEAIITKADEKNFKKLKKFFKDITYIEKAGIIVLNRKRRRLRKTGILIITAGTSDVKIAEESSFTCELFGNKAEKLYDVGAAGIHRLFSNMNILMKARVIVVVAGMDGVLPTIVSGLVSVPVIAVPTSIGYGSNMKGLSALLTMLNSCSPGIAVMNIDNGFGAGYFASLIVNIRR